VGGICIQDLGGSGRGLEVELALGEVLPDKNTVE